MNITFCGERGLVNSIILDMGSDLEKHKNFLSAIKFNDEKKLSWISNIEKIPHYIIEPSLAQFGNPDLIVVAEEKDGTRHVIFIEAKLCAYDDASEDIIINEQLPNTYKNASKVNIQLAFKYRFAETYTFNFTSHYIEEDKTSEIKYKDKLRSLKDSSAISLCRQYFIRCKDFMFVGLTNDKSDVSPYNNPSFLPAIGKAEWQKNREKFGILSYQMLEDADVVNKNSGYYKSAVVRLLALPADIGSSCCDKHISTINMDKWTAEQQTALGQLYEKLKQEISGGEVIKLEGSYSIKVDNRTIVKFYADGKKIYIALRNDNLPVQFKNCTKVKIGVGQNPKSFALIYEGSENIGDDIIQVVKEFVEMNLTNNLFMDY